MDRGETCSIERTNERHLGRLLVATGGICIVLDLNPPRIIEGRLVFGNYPRVCFNVFFEEEHVVVSTRVPTIEGWHALARVPIDDDRRLRAEIETAFNAALEAGLLQNGSR